MDTETTEIGGNEREFESEESTGYEPDLRPEYCHYRDEGCEFARSCLNCPFEQCLFEEPRGRQRWLKERRHREIKRLHDGGRGKRELAVLFGVSLRTIQRALKNGGAESPRYGKSDGGEENS